MFRKVICPVGRKESSFYAVPTAIAIAKAFKAHLFLLHLDEKFMDEEERVMLRVSVRKIEEEIREEAIKAEADIEAICKKHGWIEDISQIVLREGVPGEDIAKEAQELGGDLLVIWTTGRNELGERIAGSTADAVVDHAKIAVLVVPKK